MVTGGLSFDDVNLMYDMCRFEKAWDPHLTSVWCAAFDEEDLKVWQINLNKNGLRSVLGALQW